MSYHHDWLMRQIETIAAMLAYMLTGKKPKMVSTEEDQRNSTDSVLLYEKLKELVTQGKFCEGENLLFAAMEEGDPEVPSAAVRFYMDLNQLSDAQLEEGNFSREEILDGLKAVCSHYGLDLF